jgi:nucleoside-diphosphate-sugar epimerase
VQLEGNERILCTGGSGFIGSHFIDFLMNEGSEAFLNLDISRPKDPAHRKYWACIDILNRRHLIETFLEFRPSCVLHLAATTDMNRNDLEYFAANVQGTKNLLDAVKMTNSVQRLIVTSTQHVIKPGHRGPKGDEDFIPYGAYGKSKVITESLTRAAGLECCWTIVRPTAVWGPEHIGLAEGIWRAMASGLYLHPKRDRVMRSFGYVKNVVYQLMKIFVAEKEIVHGKLFYLGDPSAPQVDWVNAFSIALANKPVRTVPRSLLLSLAIIGEILRWFGVRFPIYLERYRNMVTSNPVPTDITTRLFGSGPYSLEQGIAETVEWLKNEGFPRHVANMRR